MKTEMKSFWDLCENPPTGCAEVANLAHWSTNYNLVRQGTPFQIENWRKILFAQFGAYALIMPEEDIQKHVDRLQEQIAQDSEAQ